MLSKIILIDGSVLGIINHRNFFQNILECSGTPANCLQLTVFSLAFILVFILALKLIAFGFQSSASAFKKFPV